jgi:hypothetical protein
MKFLGMTKKSDTQAQAQAQQGGRLTPITKEERDFQVEQIRQERYAIEVEGEKQDLRKAAAVTATKAVKANTAEVKGHIAQERFTQAGHQLKAAQIDTQRTSLLPQNAQVRLGIAQSASNVLQVQATVKQAKDKLKERNFNLLVGSNG